MSKITGRMLGNSLLKHGELLEITFPSGAVRTLIVHIVDVSNYYSLRHVFKAYAYSTWEGLPVSLEVEGLEARRV
jgi:hypothetical protein